MVRSRVLATDEHLLALDVRVGTIVAASILRGARKPSFAPRKVLLIAERPLPDGGRVQA
jgi:hypothetical protein